MPDSARPIVSKLPLALASLYACAFSALTISGCGGGGAGGSSGGCVLTFPLQDKVIFTRIVGGTGRRMHVMNLDGSCPTVVSNSQLMRTVAISPDGNLIAFEQDWATGAGSTIEVRASDDSVEVGATPNLNGAFARDPAFSPNSQRVVYSFQPVPLATPQIRIADADDFTTLEILSDSNDEDPIFTRDGAKIVFVSERDGNREIYAMDADGSNPIRLTSNLGIDEQPATVPDGRIVFVSERDGNAEIYIMNANGSNATRLTHNAFIDSHPTVTADGSRIIFMSTRDGLQQIYSMNLDGSNVTRLTESTADDRYPSAQ